MKQKLSKIKAAEMLKNPPHGNSLTNKQQIYFQSVVDGTNTYKSGGWLNRYDLGGKMQEYQPNFNNSSVSIPKDYVGDGYNTKGRNYSPSWGGSFKDGGQLELLDQLTNFTNYNTKQPGGWLNQYNK